MYSDEVANVVKLIQNCKYDKALSEAEKALYRVTKELGGNHPDFKDIPLRDIFPALALKKMTYEYSCLYKKISRLCD